jgi:hypothetical protein
MDGTRSQRSVSARVSAGLSIILFTGLGAVLAANLSLGGKLPAREFGQGSYQIKACDSWITMDLLTQGTGTFGAPPGFSALTGISIAHLDTKQCASTNFTINILDTHNLPLPAYRTDGAPALCAELLCKQDVTSQREIGLVIDKSGTVTVANSDSFHSLEFDAITSIYSVHFLQPAILANDVGRLIIQSSNSEK